MKETPTPVHESVRIIPVCIPEDIATEVSAAICVLIESNLEDTMENRNLMQETLSQDGLTCKVSSKGFAKFAVNGNVLFEDAEKANVAETETRTEIETIGEYSAK